MNARVIDVEALNRRKNSWWVRTRQKEEIARLRSSRDSRDALILQLRAMIEEAPCPHYAYKYIRAHANESGLCGDCNCWKRKALENKDD